ncbi:MAG: capsule assembly Wzi family protein [Candidatus Hatepunaea meridiana]|nr:capsule assembly Wzi family protein [Candidatus Hatepunaea meridiana]
MKDEGRITNYEERRMKKVSKFTSSQVCKLKRQQCSKGVRSFILHLSSFILVFIIALFFSASLYAVDRASAYVPVEDPVYEFIEQCVAKGILPVWSINTRPVSRVKIAKLLGKVVTFYPHLDDKILEADLDYYLREFAYDFRTASDTVNTRARRLRLVRYKPEIALNNPHWHVTAFEMEQFRFIFDPLIWFRYDTGSDESIFRRATGIQFRGDYKSKIGFYFRFVDNVERGNGPYFDRKGLLEDRFGYVGPLLGGDETYYDMTEAYLTVSLAGVEMVFGKDRVAWGHSRDSGLLLSGLSPSFNQFRLKSELFNRVRFSYLIGYLNAFEIPTETSYQTENGWSRIDKPQKWIASHRLEYTPWDFLVLAINESVIWGERGIDLSYLNPINFYFSAEHDGGDYDNVLMSGDITVRISKSILLYSELLIDDMKLATLGRGDPGNKFGYLFGAKLLNTGVNGLSTGIEYTRLDPYVYTHFFPVNRYTTWTSSLGSNIGANSDRLRLWAAYRPVRQLRFDVQIDHNRKGDVGADPTDSVKRNRDLGEKVYFLDDNSENWISTEASVEWELLTSFFLCAGWINGDKRSTAPDGFYLETGYRY